MSLYKQLFAVMLASLCITANVYAEEEFSISITGPDEEVAPAPAPARAAQPAQPARPAPTVATRPTTPAANAGAGTAMPSPATTTPALPQTPNRPALAQGQGQGQGTQTPAPNAAAQGAQGPATPNAGTPLQPQFMAQHVVAPRETIWSIAHRYSAPYANVNEFQAVASIYRNNRNAFDNDNVNNVRRGATLNIPVAEEMALEQTSTGSELLSRGTATLPPLDRSSLLANNQGQQGQQTAAAGQGSQGDININVTQNNQGGGQMSPITGSDNPLVPPLSDGTPVQTQTPTFVARETMLRGATPIYEAPEGSYDNPYAQVITDEQLAADNAARTQENVPQLSHSSLDLHAIEQLLDKTERNIQSAQQDIYQRLDSNIQRSAQVARATAEEAAKEEVGALINQYEQIIAQLQQSNSDLRSSLSRINKQVEQIRGMQIETADSVAALGQKVEDTSGLGSSLGGSGSSNKMSLESGPVMWILLGFGVLALLLSIGLFVFKSRMRRDRANRFDYDDDDGDFVDDDDMEMSELLARSNREANNASLAAHEEQAAETKPEAKKEAVKDAPPPIIDEAPAVHDDGGFDAGFDNNLGDFAADPTPAPAPAPAQPKAAKLPDFHDEIVMPSAAPLTTSGNGGAGAAAAGAVAGAAAGLAAGAAMAAARPAPAPSPAPAPAAPISHTPEDEAQAAWDSVATNASTALDKSVANAAGNDWAKSLDEKEASANQVDLGGDFGDLGADSGTGGDFGDLGADSSTGGDFGDLGGDTGGFGDLNW